MQLFVDRAITEHIGPQCQLVLLSAPGAMGYYPKVGFKPATHAWFIPRLEP